MSSDQRLLGRVKWFGEERGYGFINGQDGTDYFVHHKNIGGVAYRMLPAGSVVEFSLEMSPQTGKQPQAVDVVICADPDGPKSQLPEPATPGRGPGRIRERYVVHTDQGHEFTGKYIGMVEATETWARLLVFRLDDTKVRTESYANVRSAILIPKDEGDRLVRINDELDWLADQEWVHNDYVTEIGNIRELIDARIDVLEDDG